MKLSDDKGSMAMEFIMVMPILLLLIFGILQLSLVIIAKQMTQYAAYCAARAAIVHNPKDFRKEKYYDFFIDKGPVHRAAAEALRPIGMLTFDPITKAPDKNYIYKQVRILSAAEAGRVASQYRYKSCPFSYDLWETEQTPAVRVVVAFDYPMLIPYAAHFINYFNYKSALPQYRFSGSEASDWQLHGFAPGEKETYRKFSKAIPTFTLVEYCTMHRPWNTETFPRIPPQDSDDDLF